VSTFLNRTKASRTGVEGVNAELWHYLARLARKSRCFSRCIHALRRAVKLFVFTWNRLVKILRARWLIATFPRALCGSLRHVRQHLREPGFTGIIQTAFIERVNLSIRRGVRALHRRTWATCRRHDRLQTHVALHRSFLHFVRPHDGLRQGKVNRSPAMAAGVTDHVWSVEEWLNRPVYL
jgi:IS1 family transposase